MRKSEIKAITIPIAIITADKIINILSRIKSITAAARNKSKTAIATTNAIALIILSILVNLEETTFVKEMISIIKNSFAWIFGYLGLWLMKWVIIDLTLNTNITKLSFEQIILRIGLDSGPKANENLNLFALFKNCFQAANIVNVSGFIITFAISIIGIIKGKIKK